MLVDILNALWSGVQNVLHWFQTLTPGGFGLILVPLIILGVITILVSRNR